MSYRNVLFKKLEEKGISIGGRKFDKYYFLWVEEIQYKFTKFDGILDMIENEDLLNDFCKKIRKYEEL